MSRLRDLVNQIMEANEKKALLTAEIDRLYAKLDELDKIQIPRIDHISAFPDGYKRPE